MRMRHHHSSRTIEAKHKTELGQVALVNYSWDEPIDVTGASDLHILQLCLLPLPKTSEARFEQHWGDNRFESFGPISLLPARQTVHCRSELRQQKSVFCGFDQAAIENWMEQRIDWEHYPFEQLLDIKNSKLRNLLLGVCEELSRPNFGSEIMVELITGQVVVELCRHLAGLNETKAYGGLSARNLRLIEERVSEQVLPPSIRELADLCDLSTRHLSRAFRTSRGLSIGEYISEWRIHHAKQLLASGTSVKSVAYSVGFSAPSNFTTAFVRETGVTPTQYLRQVRRAPGRH